MAQIEEERDMKKENHDQIAYVKAWLERKAEDTAKRVLKKFYTDFWVKCIKFIILRCIV